MSYDEFVVWIQKTLKSENLDLYIIFSSFLSEFLSRSVNFEDRVLIFWDNHPETYKNGPTVSDLPICKAKYVFKLLESKPPAENLKNLKIWIYILFSVRFWANFCLEASILKIESSYFETITLKHIQMVLSSQIFEFLWLNMFSSFWNSSRQLILKKNL